MNLRPLVAPLLGLLLLAGCATSEVSNLTPRSFPVSTTHTYPFEVTWDSSRRGVKDEDVTAWVMVDQALYPMRRVPNTVNRWEAHIPIPGGKTYIPYKYKFDYAFRGINSRLVKSEWSPEYRLVVPQH